MVASLGMRRLQAVLDFPKQDAHYLSWCILEVETYTLAQPHQHPDSHKKMQTKRA